MAVVVITLKVMPVNPDVNLDKLYERVCQHIRSYIDEKHKEDEIRKDIEPIGFGLKALKLIFVMDESIGDTEPLERTITEMEEVESVEITDVRRAIG